MIDGYELVRPFQHSDRVWLATKDDQRWTIKFAPLEARDDEEILARFIKEEWNAQRAAEAAPDLFVAAFTPERATARYYVQEFVEAPSLKSVLKARALGPDEAVALGRMLAKAGQRLLGLDLVHGDVKPENVLVVSDYAKLRFKLIDFGSAAAVFSVTSRAGTASYLAPERFHGEPISERTEIFAIGVTLYEALTRQVSVRRNRALPVARFPSAEATERSEPRSFRRGSTTSSCARSASIPSVATGISANWPSTSNTRTASSRSFKRARPSSNAIRSDSTAPASGCCSPRASPWL